MKERIRRLKIAQYKTELKAYKILAAQRGLKKYFKEDEIPETIVYNVHSGGIAFIGHWKEYADLIMEFADFSVLDIYDPNDDSSFEIYFNEWILWAIKETKKDLKKLKKR